ncbi:MAG: hypothetical protein K8U57_35465 [Planctomycetes bacterium]|nr:hypothetical protein [Planctomycetota bacterium]
MFLPILLAVCAADLRPLDLGGMTLDRARILDGKPVTVSFIVGRPTYTLLGRTRVGAADRNDDVERGAVLLGKRFDVKEGERVVVLRATSDLPQGRRDERADRASMVRGAGYGNVVSEMGRCNALFGLTLNLAA